MDAIYEDIIQLEPIQPEYWTCPYQITDDARIKMGTLQRFYRRYHNRRHRIGMLIHMYYMGELLDILEELDYKRVKLIMTPYQREVANKVYTLFAEIGIDQLLRTRILTVTRIQKITKMQIQDLISRAKSFLTTTFEIQVRGGLLTLELDVTTDAENITWELSDDNAQ
jgi:hypothetical protein